MKNQGLKFISAISAALLVACGGGGGGGGDDGPGAPPFGLYEGTTADGRTIGTLVLDDGSYYVVYSIKNDPSLVGGFIQGTGTYNKGKFTSANTKDFNIDSGVGVLSASLSANFTPKTSISGTLAYATGTNSFSGRYSTEYEKTANLSILAGTYTGQMGHTAGANNMTLTVSATGAVSGTVDSSCPFSGLAAPKTTGNAYIVTVTFNGSTCLFDNQTMTGAAYLDAATKTLRSININPARTQGVLFIGAKP